MRLEIKHPEYGNNQSKSQVRLNPKTNLRKKNAVIKPQELKEMVTEAVLAVMNR